MTQLMLTIAWAGPYGIDDAVARLDDAGPAPEYAGADYGLYQIYGTHILSGRGTLLYVGHATQQTFAARLRQHRGDWLEREDGVEIYVGRIDHPDRHTANDQWSAWVQDVCMAEAIMIYKYSPNYNNVAITNPPRLTSDQVSLVHTGNRHLLEERDTAPLDWEPYGSEAWP